MIEIKEIKNYEEFNSFKEENKEVLHVVKVGAEWCGPCKMASKMISNLNQELIGNTMFAEVDIEEEGNDDIVTEFGIRNIPVILVFKDNELVEKKVGSLTADALYKLIEEHK
jgi:thioredoxin 1